MININVIISNSAKQIQTAITKYWKVLHQSPNKSRFLIRVVSVTLLVCLFLISGKRAPLAVTPNDDIRSESATAFQASSNKSQSEYVRKNAKEGKSPEKSPAVSLEKSEAKVSDDKEAKTAPVLPTVEQQETPEQKINRLLTIYYDPSSSPEDVLKAGKELEQTRGDEETESLVDALEQTFVQNELKENEKDAVPLKDLSIECFADQEIRDLKGKTISKLILNGSDITSNGLSGGRFVRNLQELSLRNLHIRPRALYRYIKYYKKLTSLEISDCNFGDEELQFVENLSNLTSLKISGCDLGEEGLRHIAKLQKLTKLDIGGVNVAPADLKYLPDYKDIDVVILPESFSYSVEGRIISLNLKANRSASIDLSAEKEVDDAVFRYLEPRSDVRTLNLSNTQITSSSFERLVRFKGLRELYLSNVSINNEDADALNMLLSQLSLKTLSLEGCESFDQQGLSSLTNGSNLEKLLLPDFPIDPKEDYFSLLKTPILKGIEQKKVVDLSGSKLDDSLLEEFVSLKGITEISLANCVNLECVPLADFESCSTVQTLDLSNTSISDSALKKLLEKRPSLNTLILQSCSKLTDESIRQIPNVENLDLRKIPRLTISGLLPLYRIKNLLYDSLYRRKKTLDALRDGNLTSISTNSKDDYENLLPQDVRFIAEDAKARLTVESVDLADCDAPIEILKVLSKFQNLKKLELINCPSLQKATKDEAKDALEHVALIEKLESLNIKDWNAPVEILEPLLKCGNLHELSIPVSHKTDVGFAYYYSIPKIQDGDNVDLSSWNTTGKSIEFAVKNLEKLKSLTLNAQVADSDLIPLVQSSTLEKLDLTVCANVTLKGLFTVLDVPNLSQIDLSSNLATYQPVIDAGLESRFVKIEIVDASELTDESLEILAAPRFVKDAEKLVLNNARYLLGKSTEHIANLKNLKSLTLTNARQKEGNDVYGILNEDLQTLSVLHNLEELDITGLHPDDDNSGLEFLKGMPQLQRLEGVLIDSEQEIACLSGTSISDLYVKFDHQLDLRSDSIFKYISRMKNLETLFIEEFMSNLFYSLSSSGLASLSNAPKLRSLFIISGNRDSQPDLSMLKGCKNLETLGFTLKVQQSNGRQKKMTTAALRQISQIKSLKRVGVLYAVEQGWRDPWYSEHIAPLSSLPKLELVAFGACMYNIESKNDALFTFPSLKELQIGKLTGEHGAKLEIQKKFSINEEELLDPYDVIEILDPEYFERPITGLQKSGRQ